MADIKTRDTVKGTIKTLDKATVAGQKMKQAYIATKEKAERSVNANENTAEEYAADKVQSGIDEISHDAVYTFDKAGRKGVRETKRNIQSAKDGFQRFKQQRAEQSLRKQTAQNTNSAIKTVDTAEKTIKQSATSSGKKTIKFAGKEAAKTTQKSVKTAEQTAKAAIKTSQQTAKAAQKTVQATVKTSQKAAQAAKATAKATATAVKAAAKATVAAVKAIIAAVKSLVAAIAAGGWVAVVVIIVLCLVGLIAGSVYGIFFSGEDSGIPFELIQSTILAEDSKAIKEKENRLSEITSEYEEILDTLSEEEKECDFVKEDSFVFAEINKALKSDSIEAETKEKLKSVAALNTEEKALKSAIKTESALLEKKTKDTIEGLSDEQVIELLKEKWIRPLIENLMQLPDSIVSELVSKLEALAKKYETTFAEVESQIEETEKSLSAMIDDLDGSEFDMLGLAELKKLLGGSAK